MKAFNSIILTALLAGGLAGLVLGGVQQFTVVPMILEAETYETAGAEEHELPMVMRQKNGLPKTELKGHSGQYLTACS